MSAPRNRLVALPILLTLVALCDHALAAPNILLIVADDLGYGDLGSYGHPVIDTPNLDSLAESGLRFTNYYAPSALCSPSRAALLTGRHPYRTGIRSWIPADSGVYLRDAEITLAEVLKQAGYQTALVGKWHLNSDLGSSDEPQPNDQGFDYFYGHNAFQVPTNHDPVNLYRNRDALGLQEGYTAELYANEAIGWLGRRDPDRPFFLYLSMAEPHTTIENPPEYNARYAAYTRGEIVPIPSGLPEPPVELLVPRGPGEYYANVTYLDAQLGRVLAWLADSGLDRDTVVVFTSDNGPVTSQWIQWFEVNAYGSTGGLRGRKHYLHEGGIRVPAIVRWPGVTEAGTVTGTPVIGTDLFVTLAAIGGGRIPGDRPIDGIDIGPLLAGHALPERSLHWALAAVADTEFAVRDGNWKLLLDRDGEPQELYDLARDPLEFFNRLAAEPAVTGALRADFERTMDSIRTDPFRPDTEMTYRYAE